MLYMVIERFKNGESESVRKRFSEQGRMMPEGLHYLSSWIETDGKVCYQLMSTERPELFNEWISHWSDIVDLEVSPVITSAEFNAEPIGVDSR